MARKPRLRALPKLGWNLARDSRGATLVEFALFFPILALMVLGTIDFGAGLASRFALDQATHRTIELANLGQRPQADYSFLVPEAAAAAGVPESQVELDQWTECRRADGTIYRAATFNSMCAVGEQSARYITVAIFKDYRPMFAYIPYIGRMGTGPNGAIRLASDSGVRVQ